MIKFNFAFIILMALTLSAYAQQQVMCEIPELPGSPPSQSPAPSGACAIDFSTYDVSAPFTIYVNLFFEDGPNGENFTPDEAVLVGHQFIDNANSQLAGLGVSNRSGPGGIIPPVVPNAKWKYKIYSEGLPGDDLGGIWLGNNPNSGMYAGKVVNINISNDYNAAGAPICFTGYAFLGNFQAGVFVTGLYACHDGFWGLGVYGRLLNHEFGHALGLDHVTYCNNPCRFDDVDPEAHCGPNCPAVATCDGFNPGSVLCTTNMPPSTVNKCKWDYSNNVMSQGVNLVAGTNTRLPDAITPCQWEIVQNLILNSSSTRVSWADDCQEIDTDFSILTGTTVTWATLVNINRNIIVEKNAILNINCEVRFANGTGIEVRPGGRLNINGAKLTNLCKDQPWNGILVEGESGQSQYTTGKHGRVFVNSGSTVENALTAIKLVDGGIIYAKASTIQNNGTGVEYLPYTNFWPFAGSQQGQPRSHFGSLTNCSFLNNDDFAKAAKLNAFVQMNGVRGINITGCSFQNQRTIKNPMGNDSYGYGIKATDARFHVTSLGIGTTVPQTTFDHSDFFGLGYGIYVGSAQTPNDNGTPTQSNDDFVSVPYTVQQATFSNCIYGIHNRFVSQGVILGNTFNLGNLPPVNALSGSAPFTNLQYGIFFENGANGFEMQENKFLGTTGNVSTTFGSYSQNLGWFNNDIRRNTYTAVNDGNVADEDNAIIAPPRGLHYLCNTNSDNKMFDFFVFNGADIRKDQGLELSGGTAFLAAGNSFTKLNSPDGDFSNGGPSVKYFHHGATEKPQFFSGLTFGNVDPNTCPAEYCLPPCKIRMEVDGFKQDFATERAAFNAVNAELQQAILSGNEALANAKEPEAAARRLMLDNLSNLIALHEAYDTVVYNLDSVRVWWKNMDSPISEMNLARDYFKHGETNKAVSILTNLATIFPISESMEADVDDFREIMLLMNGQSAQTLSHQQIQQLLAFANGGNGVSAAWAKNILTVQGFHFPPLPKMPQSNAIGGGDRRQDKPNIEVLAQFSVSPNPASNRVEFSKKAGILSEGFSVEVSDMTGKIIWQARNSIDGPLIWDTESIQNGLYFYSILSLQGLRQSGRIVVIK
jgi:hypothetical protein